MQHRRLPGPTAGREVIEVQPKAPSLAVIVVTALALTAGVGLTVLGGGGPWAGRGAGPADAAAEGAADGPSDEAARAHTEGYAVWARNDDGRPVRWDPCRTVVLVVDPTGAPAGAEDDLAEAVDRLRAASGLDLVVAGRVDERPDAQRRAYQPQRYGENWAPVLVAWARPNEADLPLRDWDRGVAIPIAAGPPGAQVFITGQVVFNVERDDLVAGFDDRATAWGSTILHELMHLLGLDHVDDPDELMWTFPGEGPVRLGPGDLAGLRAIGAPQDTAGDDTAGCLQVPPPRDVEVVGTPGA